MHHRQQGAGEALIVSSQQHDQGPTFCCSWISFTSSSSSSSPAAWPVAAGEPPSPASPSSAPGGVGGGGGGGARNRTNMGACVIQLTFNLAAVVGRLPCMPARVQRQGGRPAGVDAPRASSPCPQLTSEAFLILVRRRRRRRLALAALLAEAAVHAIALQQTT